MSPWCAVAVETKTGREVGSPPVCAWGEAPRRIHHTIATIRTAATISQIHQRLLCVDGFCVVYCSGFLETVEFACCSVTCTPQVDEGQSSSWKLKLRTFYRMDETCVPRKESTVGTVLSRHFQYILSSSPLPFRRAEGAPSFIRLPDRDAANRVCDIVCELPPWPRDSMQRRARPSGDTIVPDGTKVFAHRVDKK